MHNYNVYRCPDPVAQVTTQPWYPYENVCPCDPTQSNPSGRGFTPCPFGVQFDKPPESKNNSTMKPPLEGALYNTDQIVPPQFNPRPLSRIGQKWLSAN